VKDPAYQQAQRRAQAGDHVRAAYWFANALTRHPGNLDLIQSFLTSIRLQAQASFAEGEAEDAFEHLNRALDLLRDRVPHVTAEDLTRLLELMEEILHDQAALVPEPCPEDDPLDVRAKDDAAQIRKGTFDLSDTGSSEELRQRVTRLQHVLELLRTGTVTLEGLLVPMRFHLPKARGKQLTWREKLKTKQQSVSVLGEHLGGWKTGTPMEWVEDGWAVEVAVPADTDIVYAFNVYGRILADSEARRKDANGKSVRRSRDVSTWLSEQLAAMEAASQFESIYTDAGRLLEEAARKPSPAAAALCLQGAEQIARQLATWIAPGERQRRIGELLERLRVEGDRVADKARDVESREAWARFEGSVHGELNTARAWHPVWTGEPSGQVQEQVERLQSLAKQLGRAAVQMNGPAESSLTEKLGEELGKLLIEAKKAQMRFYNRWVIARLTVLMKEGDARIGIIDDELGLGDRMLEHLGPIDTRYLTFEVNRCFSEVFEHFFSHLHKPDDETDFTTRGHKLWLLASLYEASKTDISRF
jgi:tetratricopeptide (TPR) repeat protein